MASFDLKVQFNDLLSDHLTSVYVGPQRVRFCRHSRLLRVTCGSFDDELQNGRDSIDLPDADPDVFRLVVHWLYGTKTTLDPPDDENDGTRKKDNKEPTSLHRYLRLYVLATRLEIPSLADKVVDIVRVYYFNCSGASSSTVPSPSGTRPSVLPSN
ncbi:hypothetical protein M432DRAFT_641344 [Thermoascus aurantiacus ATCC 26904]